MSRIDIGWFCRFFMIALLLSRVVVDSACLENSDYQRFFPRLLGDPQIPTPDTYAATCDTVIVREGDTSQVYAANRIYFAKPSAERSILWVKGTLIVEGTSKHPVYLSGGLQSNSLDLLVPTQDAWGGIRVAKGGKVILKHVRIFGAKIPVSSLSQQVEFDSVYITGGVSILGPGGYQLRLSESGTTLYKTRLSDLITEANQPVGEVRSPRSAVRDSAARPSPERHIGEKKRSQYWLWGGVGLGMVAAGVGAAAWYWADHEASSHSGEAFPANPSLPTPPLRP